MSEHKMKYMTGLAKPLKASNGVVTPKKINSADPNRPATDTGTVSVKSKIRIASKMQKLAIAFWLNASLVGRKKLNAISTIAISPPNSFDFCIAIPPSELRIYFFGVFCQFGSV